ncbi:MAG TPA: hypothetical protein VIV60_09620 [Polyangiaceae bacterium]
MIGVPLRTIIDVARRRQIILPGELAGYIVLGVVDASRPLGARAALDEIRLGDDGRVIIGTHKSDVRSGQVDYRRILAELLEVADLPSLALRRAASGAGSSETFSTDLQTSLIPVNRAAARRRLARLYRELLKLTLPSAVTSATPLAPPPPDGFAVDAAGSDASTCDKVDESATGVSFAEPPAECAEGASLASVPPVAPADDELPSVGRLPKDCSVPRGLSVEVRGDVDPETLMSASIPDLEVPRLLHGRDTDDGPRASFDAQSPATTQLAASEHTLALTTNGGESSKDSIPQIGTLGAEQYPGYDAFSGYTMPLSVLDVRAQGDAIDESLRGEHTKRLFTWTGVSLSGAPERQNVGETALAVHSSLNDGSEAALAYQSSPDVRNETALADQSPLNDSSVAAPPEPSIVLPLVHIKGKNSRQSRQDGAACGDEETSIDTVIEVSGDEIEYLITEGELASCGDDERILPEKSEFVSSRPVEIASYRRCEIPFASDELTSHDDIELLSLDDGELTALGQSEPVFIAANSSRCFGLPFSDSVEPSTVDAVEGWNADSASLPIEVEPSEDIENSLGLGDQRPSHDSIVGSAPSTVTTLYCASPAGTVRRSDIADLSPRLLDHSSWTEAALCETLRAVAGLQN